MKESARKNPMSIWFVPLICNAYGIVVIVYAIADTTAPEKLHFL
jgi:paraquat-inducible protein B